MYLCSLPNPKSPGQAKPFRSDDPDLIERWKAAEDRPGFGIYYCPNPLKPGAAKHGKESTARIEVLYWDLDYKNIVEGPATIKAKIATLLLKPSEIADSGHGLHIKYNLKEPIERDSPDYERACRVQEALIDYFAADPSVRPYSLLRVPGTTNSKEEPFVKCEIVSTGPEVDLTELEEMLDIVSGNPLLERKPTPETNGDAGAAPAGERTGPVDVEAEFSSMHDGGSTNAAQIRIIPSLLHKGEHPDDVLKFVVDETMARVGDKLGWKREVEIPEVRKRILSGYNNVLLLKYDPATGVIPSWLPAEFHKDWIERLEAGRSPVMAYNRGGFYVRSKQASGTADTAYGSQGETNEAHAGANNPNDNPGADSTKAEKPAGKRRVLELRPFVPFDVALLPPRSWLYGKHYQRRTVSLTAGPGGMGKSSLDMVEAIAMATGRNLLGEQPEERLRVCLHNGEDPRDEIDRRLAAILQYYNIPQEELQGWLWTTSGTEFPLRVAKGYANLEINSVLVRQISAAISDNQIDMAGFDPLVTLHTVSEVDPGKMDMVVRLFAGIGDENNTAVELTHHVRKPAAGVAADYDVHDIRGVTSTTDAVRAARVLNRMSEKDAEAAGCGEMERLSRFRVDRAKGNYSPAQAATWRQFINVEIANGDEVGVVTPWDFPGQGEQTPEKVEADQKADQVFLHLLRKFLARGINVSANTGPTYAPARFAEDKEAKLAKLSKAALRGAMDRLLDVNRIRSEPVRADGRSHRLVPSEGAGQ
jgi:RecA-family ATPase